MPPWGSTSTTKGSEDGASPGWGQGSDASAGSQRSFRSQAEALRAIKGAVQPDINAAIADVLADPIVALQGPNPDAVGNARAHDSSKAAPGSEGDEHVRDEDDEDDDDDDAVRNYSDSPSSSMYGLEDLDEDDSNEEWRDHIVDGDA